MKFLKVGKPESQICLCSEMHALLNIKKLYFECQDLIINVEK